MNTADFNQYCASFVAATHVVQWGRSDVWKVAGKVFAIGSTTQEGEPAYTFKASDRNFAFLLEAEGYRPAPYLASRGLKWIQQIDASAHLDEELKYYIAESYRLVVLGLSKRQQIALSAESPQGE